MKTVYVLVIDLVSHIRPSLDDIEIRVFNTKERAVQAKREYERRSSVTTRIVESEIDSF